MLPRISVSVFLSCLFLAMPLCGLASAETAAALSISVPEMALMEGERIIAFDMTITSGAVKEIVNIPKGWSVELEGETGYQTRVTGDCNRGPGGLSSADNLPQILVIPDIASEGDRPPFEVKIVIHISNDTGVTRAVKIPSPSVIITKERI